MDTSHKTIKILLFLFIIVTLLLELTISIQDIPIEIIKPKEERIGYLIIEKIHLKEELYPKDNIHNTIEEHVSILEESIPPNQKNSIMLLAAHSGTANVSYFQNLNQLELNDEIILIYEKKTYTYQISEIWKEKKNGYIHINQKKQKQLILTTCDPIQKDYQLIISCTEKES